MTAKLLELHDVHTHIATPRGVVKAVDGVSFDLLAGEAFGLVGESGSGKSVLARTLMGITHPQAKTSGEVLFEGRNILAMSEKERRSIWGRRIAMVFQDPGRALNPVVKVERQLTEGMREHLGIGRTEAHGRALKLLQEVGVPDPERRLGNYPYEMSGGMRQRVMIASALACEPDLLVADEPTTALDVTIQRQILDLLRRVQRERSMATLLISHDLNLVGGRSDHVAVMYAGKLAEIGTARDIFSQPRHRYTAALFGATPTIDHPRHAPLVTIPGTLPDATSMPPGCRFVARCAAAISACHVEQPAMVRVDGSSSQHLAACNVPQQSTRTAHYATIEDGL